MGVRLLAAGGASLVVIGMFAVMVQVSSDARRVDVAPQSISALEGPGWTVTRTNAAHHAMVVEVEAQRLEEAREIAGQIVKPALSRRYEEILIYVRPPGSGIDAAMRRIQWTPNGGFVETVYDAP